jgi:YHS domain-containing protein
MMSPATMHHQQHEQMQYQQGKEQSLCPVMGGAINKKYFIEYQGKRVYFCCPGCEDEFLKNPEKYMDKLPQFENEK